MVFYLAKDCDQIILQHVDFGFGVLYMPMSMPINVII